MQRYSDLKVLDKRQQAPRNAVTPADDTHGCPPPPADGTDALCARITGKKAHYRPTPLNRAGYCMSSNPWTTFLKHYRGQNKDQAFLKQEYKRWFDTQWVPNGENPAKVKRNKLRRSNRRKQLCTEINGEPCDTFDDAVRNAAVAEARRLADYMQAIKDANDGLRQFITHGDGGHAKTRKRVSKRRR